MKAIISVIVLLFITVSSFANIDKPLVSENSANAEKGFSLTPEVGITLGGSYMNFGNVGSMFNQSIAPTLSWKPLEKLRITAGAVVSNYNFGSSTSFSALSFNSGTSDSGLPQSNFASSLFFVAGSYELSSRLTISGAGYYDQNKAAALFQPTGMMFNNSEIKGMMLGLDYKISENFRFGAEINFSSGYNPMSPLNQGFYNSSPFGRYNGW
jgi:hypothetical protein